MERKGPYGVSLVDGGDGINLYAYVAGRMPAFENMYLCTGYFAECRTGCGADVNGCNLAERLHGCLNLTQPAAHCESGVGGEWRRIESGYKNSLRADRRIGDDAIRPLDNQRP